MTSPGSLATADSDGRGGFGGALDHPIWAALTTGHEALAEGGPLALRYPSDIAPFAAMSDSSEAAYDALRGLIPPEGRVALFTPDKVLPAFGLEIQLQAPIIQMVAPDLALALAPDVATDYVVLGISDALEMLQLAEMTRPGPFGPRTHELGEYIGIRVDGQLVAMAGERMRLDGLVEISAVCVHPDHRGKSYAKLLITQMAQNIRDRGGVPFLHVFSDNESAIALYRRLQFTVRRRLYVTGLRHAGRNAKVSV